MLSSESSREVHRELDVGRLDRTRRPEYGETASSPGRREAALWSPLPPRRWVWDNRNLPRQLLRPTRVRHDDC